MKSEKSTNSKQNKMENKIQSFEKYNVRSIWDEEQEKWWFSVVDIVAILTDSDYQNARKYWKVLKGRLKDEGSELFYETNESVSNTIQLKNELVTNCYQLKMLAADGKYYKTDVADTEQILRLIQSIPNKKAEPFKMWLARVGRERIDEAIDPELSIDRAIQNYRQLGYSENWINQRIKSIEVRKTLTDEWDKAGVKQGNEYAFLTDLMTKTWSGMTTKQYKQHKSLKKENLRDNMTNLELIINMLAEATTTELSSKNNPKNLQESTVIAQKGAYVAKNARLEIEQQGGKVITSQNTKQNKILRLLLFVFCFLPFFGIAQHLTLSECYAKTEKNYPLIQQLELIDLSAKYNLQNVSRAWIPQLQLFGKATLQSDAPNFEVSYPPILNLSVDVPKDQYQAYLQLNQIIWDGGQIRSARKTIQAASEAQRKQNEVDMYALRGRINELFFGIILYDSQIEQINVNLQELQRNLEKVISYAALGFANESDIDAVKVEQITAEQQIIQLTTMREAFITMLGAFMGEELSLNITLQKPEIVWVQEVNNRLELQLFDAFVDVQKIQNTQILSKNMPKLGLFVQGGFARPGLNMFDTDGKLYAIGGVQLNWGFGNLYTIKNEKRIIENNVNAIEVNRKVFLFNQSLQIKQQSAIAEQYRKILASDDEIIRMRETIYKASEAKTENGILSVTDLMRDLNMENAARAQKIVHEVHYLKALYDLKNLYNN
jgi:outer membrane protein TolC